MKNTDALVVKASVAVERNIEAMRAALPETVAEIERRAAARADGKVKWAVLWLNDLIRDGRIDDLDPDDEYVRWAKEARDAVIG